MDVYEYPEPAPGRPDRPVPDPPPASAPDAPADRGSARSTLVKGGGLLLAGLVAGAIGVGALHSSSTPALAASGGTSAGSAPFDRGAFGGRGGVDGERHVVGTLSAVSASSVTVTSPAGGTTTVPVDGSTQVLRDGSTVALSSLEVGEAVVVHVLPSGSSTVAEKVVVGTLQGPDGGGSVPPGDGDGPGDGGQSGTPPGGTTTNT